jgi:type IV pilus assembly protein PilV
MSRQGGFSLLEVLISSAVLATALLGLATLMLRGMEDAAASRDELVAAILLRDLAGRQAVAGEALLGAAPGSFAARELDRWRALVSASLPQGEGTLCRDTSPVDGTAAAPGCSGAGVLVAKVFWSERVTTTATRQTLALAP